MYIVVAGGGTVGGVLVQKLIENKHDVIMIEQDKALCEKMYAETGVVVIGGSAGRIGILKEAKIEKADVFVAATGSDADNLAATIMAKSFKVPQVIVRMRDHEYENAYHVAGADVIVRITDLMVNQMISEIEKPEVQKISSIGGGKADIFRIVVPSGAKVSGKSVKELTSDSKFPAQCTFIGVYKAKGGDFMIPRGDQVIEDGDELYMVSPADDIKAVSDFITDTSKGLF